MSPCRPHKTSLDTPHTALWKLKVPKEVNLCPKGHFNLQPTLFGSNCCVPSLSLCSLGRVWQKQHCNLNKHLSTSKLVPGDIMAEWAGTGLGGPDSNSAGIESPKSERHPGVSARPLGAVSSSECMEHNCFPSEAHDHTKKSFQMFYKDKAAFWVLFYYHRSHKIKF